MDVLMCGLVTCSVVYDTIALCVIPPRFSPTRAMSRLTVLMCDQPHLDARDL